MDWTFGLGIGVLVYAAFVFDFFGFLARDELLLRLLMLAASCLYMFYYYFVTDEPLWDALTTNGALLLANLAMIVVVIFERTTFGLSREAAALFMRLRHLSPGQFRLLLRHATWHRVEATTRLTTEGAPLDRLYYVTEGPMRIAKGRSQTRLASGTFVGEIAFATGAPASASVELDPGAVYLSWDGAGLHALLKRKPALATALTATFNTDLMGKVASSSPGTMPRLAAIGTP